MHYQELIKKVSKKSLVSQRQTKDVIDSMIYIIIERLYKGDSVNLKNLCDFKAKSRHARNVRNPQTKEIMTCKEVRVPKAVFSQSVKKIINGKV